MKSTLKQSSLRAVSHLAKPSEPGTVIILIPIGLPGMGKTHFVESQLKNALGAYP